ncbi:LPS assembly protein LptD [Sphingomonas sp.]|uniref:LPS-assembly protein LptD n=1 Tax=Sphingomonas sp. TaxID=28214 RepID=UPI001D30F1DB|nr:LPS assembly protein LptD [Sphingomonas sp.]MBX9796758.1 LPS assembly protein LptD [Sphingomonas sp.]
MRFRALLESCATLAVLVAPAPLLAQSLQDRASLPAPPEPATPDRAGNPEDPGSASDTAHPVSFSADEVDYDTEKDIIVATGDVRMYREGNRLRADRVVWNRNTGQVVANGNVVVINPRGDTAYGDEITLTDTLKDGVVDNMLVVLDRGARLAAEQGRRDESGITLTNAAFTPCAVVDSGNCPKQPSWKISAVRIFYNPEKKRVYYKGAQISVFGVATIPLPAFSNPVGNGTNTGLLAPDIRFGVVNGFEYAQPYYISISENRGLKITPRFFSRLLPMAQAEYTALTSSGAYRIAGYATASDRTDAELFGEAPPRTVNNVFRGYLEGSGRFILGENWSASGSFRVASDRTFLRRYDISRDDLLRSTMRVDRIDTDSYFAITGWAVQTLRINDRQGLQPVALPEIDYRRRFRGVLTGVLELQANTIAISRSSGQDTQRAFVSGKWDMRRVLPWGQELTLTGYLRGDLYNAVQTELTTVASYRGNRGVTVRGIAAFAVDVKWPFIGRALGGALRVTPRAQLVASPKIANLLVPNEDSRAVDLEDSNLFALNRFPGYDRFGGTTRFVYGVDWGLTLPDFTITGNIGQSYRFSSLPEFVPVGTGFSDSLSDIVGRTEIRFQDLLAVTHRFRLDKDNFGFRRNELDLTVGTRGSYLLLGYLRLNRQITPTLEDLRDREEVRAGGRLQITRFWSVFGSGVIDLTTRRADPRSLTDGFSPVRHRAGVTYEDDCLRLGITWRRDYQDTGDARSGDAFLLTLSFKNLGR